jgi:fatty acid desaturase
VVLSDRWFRYSEDRLPIACFALCFAVDLAVFYLCPWWGAAAWLILGIFPKACISSWGHHHQHLYMFRPAWLNRCLEFILGFQTGATSHAWFLHHVVGHHPHYKDQSQDESAWQTPSGRQMGTIEYAVVVTATSYWRCNRNGPRFPRHWRIFLSMLVLHLAAVAMFCWYNCRTYLDFSLYHRLAYLLSPCRPELGK